MNRISAVLLCFVTTIAATVTTARAQTNETVQAMCSNQAHQSWPDEYRHNQYQRARQQVYINCMMEHGLRP